MSRYIQQNFSIPLELKVHTILFLHSILHCTKINPRQKKLQNRSRINMEKMLKYIVPACLIFLYTNNILAQQPSKITAIAIEIYQAGNSEEAIRLLQQAISIDPNFLDATLILGQIYLETNQPKSAKNILLKS